MIIIRLIILFCRPEVLEIIFSRRFFGVPQDDRKKGLRDYDTYGSGASAGVVVAASIGLTIFFAAARRAGVEVGSS